MREILEALLTGGLLSDEALERLMGDPGDGDSRSGLEDLVDRLIEGLTKEGYITEAPGQQDRSGEGTGDGRGRDAPPVRFEVTDKSLDFLGYRALRDLLGSLGKSSFGRHDTRLAQ